MPSMYTYIHAPRINKIPRMKKFYIHQKAHNDF